MPKRHSHKTSNLPQVLAIGGLVLIILAIFTFKGNLQAAEPTEEPNMSNEAKLDLALAEHAPVMAFYHSTNRQQCLIMIDFVNEDYPEFSTTVELVDINVHAPNNSSLLQRVGLQYIPTMIFYDREGQSVTRVGVMEAEELHQTLINLVQGN